MSQSTRVVKLQRILDIACGMATTTDLEALLGMIVDAACDVLDCERATIFLYDQGSDELVSRVATGGEVIRFPADRGIAGAAAQSRRVIHVPDAYADERFNPEVDRRTGFRTRNLLTFPLENQAGHLIGVLQALNRRIGAFTSDDEELARVLAAQAGVAIHRQRLLEAYAERQRMLRDLSIARDIQQALFPRQDPVVPGYDVTGWNRPADETGGDCYDFIPLANDRLAVFLADATGHGIAAALVMVQCRALLRAMLTVTDDLRSIATRVNALLAQDMADGRFVTAFIGILDPERDELRYVSGGQGPLLLLAPGEAGQPAHVVSRDSNDIPFAAVEDREYAAPQTFLLPAGAMVALLTDGFYETMRRRANASAPGRDAPAAPGEPPEDETFGEQRVRTLLAEHLTAPLPQVIAALHAGVSEFSEGAPQADDLTAVLIRRRA